MIESEEKMSIGFRIAEHSVQEGVQICEVLVDEQVVGVIYPTEKGIKIVSAHFYSTEGDNGVGKIPPIPSISINFNPQPYSIIDGTIRRQKKV